MKNILVAFAIFFAVTSTCHAENIVSVCDFDSRAFSEFYNRWLNLGGLPDKAAIDKSRIVTRSYPEYDAILLPLKNFSKGEGTAIALVTDKNGVIFGISLQNTKKSTSDDMAAALAITLIVVGLNKDEMNAVLDELKLNGETDTFIPSIGKFLKIASDVDDSGVGTIEITAHD